jgi:lipoprotein-anchoring transpeptidase ErfK/SrfK
MNGTRILAGITALVLATACDRGAEPEPRQDPPAQAAAQPRQEPVSVAWDVSNPRTSPEELDSLRADTTWRSFLQPEDGGPTGPPNRERWEQIEVDAVNGTRQHLPIHGDVAGPSALRVQILLNLALFSPGIISGRWGKTSAEAIYWFQRREGLPATARGDSATLYALRRAAGDPQQLIVRHTLTADDVSGPFVDIPEDIYEQAELECSCYESLSQKLSERFHVTPELLAQLNAGVQLDSVRAGQVIHVPSVRAPGAGGAQVARIVISGRGSYLHAMDDGDRILYHFPATLGSQYSPSPTGDFRVTSITHDPEWHYQPTILEGIDSEQPSAIIPAGPNVAVGTVWIALSQRHFGIHGTAEPETIGYATSNGCVRLTNWDAEFLARHIRPGTPVEFRDIPGQTRTRSDSARGNTLRARRDTAS